MNMKDAFRFQNKLKALMCEATAILEDRRNIVKVKTTHLRSKVMSDTQDAVVEEAAPSEYAGHANEVAAFLMSLLEEREKLCRAIHTAKNSLDLDMEMCIRDSLYHHRPQSDSKEVCVQKMLEFQNNHLQADGVLSLEYYRFTNRYYFLFAHQAHMSILEAVYHSVACLLYTSHLLRVKLLN